MNTHPDTGLQIINTPKEHPHLKLAGILADLDAMNQDSYGIGVCPHNLEVFSSDEYYPRIPSNHVP
jgi:hypothetical protein